MENRIKLLTVLLFKVYDDIDSHNKFHVRQKRYVDFSYITLFLYKYNHDNRLKEIKLSLEFSPPPPVCKIDNKLQNMLKWFSDRLLNFYVLMSFIKTNDI